MSEKSGVIIDKEYNFEKSYSVKECESDGKVLKKLAHCINESRRRKINSELAKGYCEMAEINIKLAEEGINSDNHALQLCEQKLAESECCDS